MIPEPDLCAALEREIERWAQLRKAQGSRAPGCSPARNLDYLFHVRGNGGDVKWRGSTQRASNALRVAESKGLVRRKRFDCGDNAWALTPRGSALAQEGRLWCYDCAEEGPWEGEDYCGRCLADRLDERAEDEQSSAEHWQAHADDHRRRADDAREAAAAVRLELARGS